MNNQLLQELIQKYKLSEEEHGVILECLKKKLFSNRAAENNPSIMFVVGQPGCGKTTYINNQDLSQYVIINSDDYRHLSKYSDEILDKYPTSYAKLTNYDAHLWGDELFSYAIQNGYSVLREKAPIDSSLLELIKTIPSEYDIVLNVVVAGDLASLLATRERYEKEILKSDNAKLSNIESYNKCYSLLPDFISECISLGAKVNYVVPFDNQFKVIPVGNDYLEVLQELRKQSNEYVCTTYEQRMDNIKQYMMNRKAPQEQFDELKKIESGYCEINSYYDNEKSHKK